MAQIVKQSFLEKGSNDVSSKWFVYVLQCADESLYTGITTDLDRRLNEHNQTSRGAKYTRCRRPVALVASWPYEDRSEASSAEWHFKKLSRSEKLRRIDASE